MPPTPILYNRRDFIRCSAIACAALSSGPLFAQTATHTHGPMSKERRDQLTPDQIVEDLKKGNERFRSGRMHVRDYRAEQYASSAGQFPAVAVLGCIDSRAPAEILFDTGIGDMFNARLAGNVVDDDVLGSLEFACKVAGAKVVVVLGHTECGAIKGAIDSATLGNLTGLLARIKPAVSKTAFSGERSSKNPLYVDAVARTNVRLGIETIRQRSAVLADLERQQAIQIVGAMSDLATGAVVFGI